MTKEQMERDLTPQDRKLLEAMERISAETLKSKEAIWELLIEAGIETEESRRKHEEKERKRRKRK